AVTCGSSSSPCNACSCSVSMRESAADNDSSLLRASTSAGRTVMGSRRRSDAMEGPSYQSPPWRSRSENLRLGRAVSERRQQRVQQCVALLHTGGHTGSNGRVAGLLRTEVHAGGDGRHTVRFLERGGD